MHPSGVQFGLSPGLLQRRGEEILLSDQLLETISLQAQMHVQLGRPAIRGNFLVDITVRAAQNALGNQYQSGREEIVPFFASLNRTMYYTLCGVASNEFTTKAVDANIKPGKSAAKIQKALFKVCHHIVKERYAKNDPDNVRHADLTALFMFNFWNATRLLPMTQSLTPVHPAQETRACSACTLAWERKGARVAH